MITTIKRENGKRIQIRVRPRIKGYGETVLYDFDVMICLPGKRKFHPAVDTDSHEYLKIPYTEREAYILRKQLEHVTSEEIYEAKLFAWQEMKPTLINRVDPYEIF